MQLYDGSAYWDYPTILNWCEEFTSEYKGFVRKECIGHSREGRPIILLTLGGDPDNTPAFWIDAGTHASEWAGVMSVIYALSRWADWYQTPEGKQWFQHNCIYVLPCISPDGFQALHEGEPFLRSSKRPAKNGVFREGFEPCDIDGDGQVKLMRWRSPAGPYVIDEEANLGVRRRNLDDDSEQACFVCQEGMFVHWDGTRWTQAPLQYGLDLNRNFPVNWSPFEMFGMDGGEFSLSEPESRCVMDAVVARPNIAVGLTNHTYTGAILTQPYNANTPLKEADVNLMERLALEGVRGTDYRVIRVYPDFTYDPKNPVVGVWADCMTCTLGIPCYTLELWDPFSWAGVKLKDPASFFKNPQQNTIEALLRKAVQDDGMLIWNPINHPQLGEVEIGGIDYLRTIRNPPISLLAKECHKGFLVAENLRKSMPRIQISVEIELIAIETYRMKVIFENLGFLSTTALNRAEEISSAKGIEVSLSLSPNVHLVEGMKRLVTESLEGWGSWQVGSAKNLIYPSLPSKGNRQHIVWILKGMGDVFLTWDAGRAGKGEQTILINESPDTPQLRLW
jgi:hypothetical protein